MNNSILGLHHITAIASDARQNFDFYTKTLGLRLVKKTVNFDDPDTYHLYYGDESGSAGTILTFFPWTGIGQGTEGLGMATEIGYSVPSGSLDFWMQRLKDNKLNHAEISERFGESLLTFRDPDGLSLSLIVPAKPDSRTPWETADIKSDTATKGFHSTTLTLQSIDETAKVLTDLFGYHLLSQEGNRYRFITDTVDTAEIVDLLELPNGSRGRNAAGTNHHVAFRVKDEHVQMEMREKILSKNLQITGKIDRDYFFSLYFREPGGVLFEIATENPGFTVDEPLNELGTNLKLPHQHEGLRTHLEKSLPELK
ncbi:glyoxalase family protein [Pedobacter westerhofensis]|uniref:Glyoxalase family protein n=1 Tax=Pedobacter westerhofensis TaxID=425512 RepID=A0A521BFN8_9SPHI|nr:ring-cleaving dioxygenase [Pedobacter westerhofensis]SMO45917.1 glyoxalase family protein [Pedobacter westerhofensis]